MDHSSQTMIVLEQTKSAVFHFFLLHINYYRTLIEILKWKWTVRPPNINTVATPDGATAQAIFASARTRARINLVRSSLYHQVH